MAKYFNISRQAYYKSEKLENKKQLSEQLCLKRLQDIREDQSKIGCRKLYYLMSDYLNTLPYKFSRDKLFELLRNNNLLVKKKRRYAVTTNSNSLNPIYPNLLKDKQVTRANEVWITDITYIKIKEGFVYLSLVADYYSRKILGYNVSPDLSTNGPFQALKRACNISNIKDFHELIHHSDRGCQYRSIEYTKYLKNKSVNISMSRSGNPYDNAVMERINGTLKDEFLLGETFSDILAVKKTAKRAITTYNEKRPHLSLMYKTPSYIYKNSIENQIA
jgi:transposase InsO family protein